jgi:hypothetical protein
VTGPDEILKAAEELEAELANAHVQQKVVQPRTQEQTERILALARKLIDDVKAWEQTQHRDERFLAIVEQLRAYTASAHERLEQVEEAIEHDGGTRTSSPVDQEIVEEGRWLSAMFAGPPTPAAARSRLRDGSTKRKPTTLETLVEVLRDETRPQQKRGTPVEQKSRKV